MVMKLNLDDLFLMPLQLVYLRETKIQYDPA